MRYLDRDAVINLFLLAHTDVSKCIDAGDGMIPRSAGPFHQGTILSAYIDIAIMNLDDQTMKWSEPGYWPLWLGDYMVMRKHLFAIR